MGLQEIFDLLIGLVTVYLVFGLVCTAVVEMISAWSGFRSRYLKRALKVFLDGNYKKGTFFDEFQSHPMIQALGKKGRKFPSYIPPGIVGQVVDILLTNNGKKSYKDVLLNTTKRKNSIKVLLKATIKKFRKNSKIKENFREAIENHFEALMDRTSGWFKRYTQAIAFFVAALLVCAANIDSISIINTLSINPVVRTQTIELAKKSLEEIKLDETKVQKIVEINAKANEKNDVLEQYEKAEGTCNKIIKNMQSAGLDLGWKKVPSGLTEWVSKVTGLLVSIFAISLGAPFWFDLLQRFMQIRAAGITPSEKREKEKSKKNSKN